MKWLCLLSTFCATAALAEPSPDFLQDPPPSHYQLRARWNGREASATKDGPAITSTSLAANSNTVSVLEPARSGKVWILHTDDRLTIALWVDHDALLAVASKDMFLPARADRDDTGVWLKVGSPLAMDGRLVLIDDGVVEASVLSRPDITGTLYQPSSPPRPVSGDRVVVVADTSLLDAVGGVRFGRFRKDAVVRRLRETKGNVLVAYANDDALVGGWIAAASVRPETEARRESVSIYDNDLVFAARAIPSGTVVYDAPEGSPIGLSRQWIPLVVEQTRDGWSEVTLGAGLAPRVWVRSEEISHLR